MSIRILPIAKETDWQQGLRHSYSTPDLHGFEMPPPPRRRQSVAELRIPKRKESVTFFASPYRNRKIVTWRTTPTPSYSRNGQQQQQKQKQQQKQLVPIIKPPLSNTFSRILKREIKDIDETRFTPRQPKRQNAIVRLTLTPNRRRNDAPMLVLPRLSRPLI